MPVFPIAAEHGTGVDDLLDAALEQIKGQSAEEQAGSREKAVEIAIIGRPNVGKSTLLNRMAGEERSIVSPIPGTTMDNVDTDVVQEWEAVPVCGYGGNPAQGKNQFGGGKVERGDGAARTGTRGCGASWWLMASRA